MYLMRVYLYTCIFLRYTVYVWGKEVLWYLQFTFKWLIKKDIWWHWLKLCKREHLPLSLPGPFPLSPTLFFHRNTDKLSKIIGINFIKTLENCQRFTAKNWTPNQETGIKNARKFCWIFTCLCSTFVPDSVTVLETAASVGPCTLAPEIKEQIIFTKNRVCLF